MTRDGKFSHFVVLFLVACFVFPSLSYKLESVSLVLQRANNPEVTGFSRLRRSVENTTNSSIPVESMGLSLPCLKPSIDDFPGDFMSQYQRKHGGAIVHTLLAMYTFIGLAILCNDYFVPSVEEIANAFSIRPDVAGATVMAAGTSGTELFSSLIGVFITKTDIGLATVVGSSSFNVLVIVALCGLFNNGTLRLSLWPLLRDNLCYLLCTVALFVVIYDSRVYWYEALVLLCMYVMYVIVLYFDKVLLGFFHKLTSTGHEVKDIETELTESEKKKLLPKRDENEVQYEVRFSGSFDPRIQDDDQNNPTPLSVPRKVLWIIALPFTCLFFVTIPDCRKDRWQNWYPVSFVVSLTWMASLTYVLIWMMAIVGFTLNIPDVIMALTFLASGSSIPDAISSLLVARQGYADMAVSHANGSNMFNILFCLGLPWLLKTTVIDVGSYVTVVNDSMSYTMICLFATAVVPVIIMTLNKLYLNKFLGIIFISLYLVFTAGTVLLGLQSKLRMCAS